MRKQYHFWPASPGLDAWDVDRLIELSADLPVVAVRPESIRELDTPYWSDPGSGPSTVNEILDHFCLIRDVDPSRPVIPGSDGRTACRTSSRVRSSPAGDAATRREPDRHRRPAASDSDRERDLG